MSLIGFSSILVANLAEIHLSMLVFKFNMGFVQLKHPTKPAARIDPCALAIVHIYVKNGQ